MQPQENLALQQIAAPMRQCAEECLNCHAVCASTLAYCISKGGEHLEPAHLRSLMDCAEICRTSASFLLRGSEQHSTTCNACVVICERCAESCEKMRMTS